MKQHVYLDTPRGEKSGVAILQKAKSLRSCGKSAEAERLLRRAVAEHPLDYCLHHELGMTLVDLNRHEEAIGSFHSAVRLNMQSDESCNAIACALASRGMHQPAAVWFERAREINPHQTKYLYMYAMSLRSLGCLKLAAGVCADWLALEPGNPVARHLAEAVRGGQENTKGSIDYVRALFNECAPKFDATLARIQYCGPHLIANVLRQLASASGAGWDIVDLGCGTGLVGIELRPLARKLVGVDLAKNMLEQARRRNIYDELVEADIVDFMGEHKDCFDVATAADVLCYTGELGDFFQAAAYGLRPAGTVVVSVEMLEGDCGFQLNPSGRYSHSLPYLRDVMEDAGLSVDIRQATLRSEGNRPVAAWIASGCKRTG